MCKAVPSSYEDARYRGRCFGSSSNSVKSRIGGELFSLLMGVLWCTVFLCQCRGSVVDNPTAAL